MCWLTVHSFMEMQTEGSRIPEGFTSSLPFSDRTTYKPFTVCHLPEWPQSFVPLYMHALGLAAL